MGQGSILPHGAGFYTPTWGRVLYSHMGQGSILPHGAGFYTPTWGRVMYYFGQGYVLLRAGICTTSARDMYYFGQGYVLLWAGIYTTLGRVMYSHLSLVDHVYVLFTFPCKNFSFRDDIEKYKHACRSWRHSESHFFITNICETVPNPFDQHTFIDLHILPPVWAHSISINSTDKIKPYTLKYLTALHSLLNLTCEYICSFRNSRFNPIKLLIYFIWLHWNHHLWMHQNTLTITYQCNNIIIWLNLACCQLYLQIYYNIYVYGRTK